MLSNINNTHQDKQARHTFASLINLKLWQKQLQGQSTSHNMKFDVASRKEFFCPQAQIVLWVGLWSLPKEGLIKLNTMNFY